MNKPTILGRLARWLFLLHEFDLTIIDKTGKANVVVDYFSRLQNDGTDTSMIDDTLPDEHIFHIDVKIPWYVDIENYLAANKIPTHFSPMERKLLA